MVLDIVVCSQILNRLIPYFSLTKQCSADNIYGLLCLYNIKNNIKDNYVNKIHFIYAKKDWYLFHRYYLVSERKLILSLYISKLETICYNEDFFY